LAVFTSRPPRTWRVPCFSTSADNLKRAGDERVPGFVHHTFDLSHLIHCPWASKNKRHIGL
jgi:hypothetical protein